MDVELITVVDTKGVVTLQTYIQVIKHRGHVGSDASCPLSLIQSPFLFQRGKENLYQSAKQKRHIVRFML